MRVTPRRLITFTPIVAALLQQSGQRWQSAAPARPRHGRIGGFPRANCHKSEPFCGKPGVVCHFAGASDDFSGRVRGKSGVICRQTRAIYGTAGLGYDESGPLRSGARAVCLRREVME